MFLVIKRKNIIKGFVIVIMLTVFATAISVSDASAVFMGKSNRKIPVYCVETEDKVVALTFDAAWGADKTRGIIELLKKYEADATFFLVGFWIKKFPDETKLIAESGFEIGNHSNNHLNMSKLNSEDINREISTVNEQIQNLTGKSPVYFRPPFGDYNNRLVECVENLNMVPVQWSVDSLDWKGISSVEITNRVLSKVHNGAIILFHNNSDYILEALPLVLVGLKNKGYRMVSIDELVLTENYYVDNSGVQHKKAESLN